MVFSFLFFSCFNYPNMKNLRIAGIISFAIFALFFCVSQNNIALAETLTYNQDLGPELQIQNCYEHTVPNSSYYCSIAYTANVTVDIHKQG